MNKKEVEVLEESQVVAPLYDEVTGEIINNENLVFIRKSGDYEIYKDLSTSKYIKKRIYYHLSTFDSDNDELMFELFKVKNDENNQKAIPINNAIDKEITIKDVEFSPYDTAINEETGGIDSGVITTILGEDGNYYITSSKIFYSEILKILTHFKVIKDNKIVKKVEIKVIKKTIPNATKMVNSVELVKISKLG